MDIALLNTEIIFQKSAVTVDTIGNRKNGWTDFYTCHATVSGEAASSVGSEKDSAGTTVDHSAISFTVAGVMPHPRSILLGIGFCLMVPFTTFWLWTI